MAILMGIFENVLELLESVQTILKLVRTLGVI